MNNISKNIINCRQNNSKIILKEFEKENLSILNGYEIQNEIHNHFSKNQKYTGWKIGCTTPVMQKYLKIPSPCIGRVMEKDLYENDSTIKFENFIRPGVECEIAIILSENYNYFEKNQNYEEIVRRVVPSIEIVDDRWPNYKNETTPMLIADDFFASSIVFGTGVETINLEGLKNVKGSMIVNNIKIGEGVGADILDDPINALSWFLDFKFQENNHPKPGDLISLGSLVQTYWVKKGDSIIIDIEKIGNVKVDFQ